MPGARIWGGKLNKNVWKLYQLKLITFQFENLIYSLSFNKNFFKSLNKKMKNVKSTFWYTGTMLSNVLDEQNKKNIMEMMLKTLPLNSENVKRKNLCCFKT